MWWAHSRTFSSVSSLQPSSLASRSFVRWPLSEQGRMGGQTYTHRGLVYLQISRCSFGAVYRVKHAPYPAANPGLWRPLHCTPAAPFPLVAAPTQTMLSTSLARSASLHLVSCSEAGTNCWCLRPRSLAIIRCTVSQSVSSTLCRFRSRNAWLNLIEAPMPPRFQAQRPR